MTPQEQLLEAVRESAKYRDVCPELIERIGRRELATRRTTKEAIKETKNALHQIAGAYLASRPRYDEWLETLQMAQISANPNDWPDACQRMMRLHASTTERLPYLTEFYATLFADLPPVRSVLDIACGLNPLAVFCMPLTSASTYFAFDIYADMMAFLNGYFTLAGINGTANVADVVLQTEFSDVDIALILKFLPVLEQQEKGASLRLLQAIPAKILLVSFPTRTLGGRGKGMAENYETRFLSLLAAENWKIERFTFPGELAFRVTKDAGNELNGVKTPF